MHEPSSACAWQPPEERESVIAEPSHDAEGYAWKAIVAKRTELIPKHFLADSVQRLPP